MKLHILEIALAVSSIVLSLNIYMLHRRVSRLEQGGKR